MGLDSDDSDDLDDSDDSDDSNDAADRAAPRIKDYDYAAEDTVASSTAAGRGVSGRPGAASPPRARQRADVVMPWSAPFTQGVRAPHPYQVDFGPVGQGRGRVGRTPLSPEASYYRAPASGRAVPTRPTRAA